MLVNSDFKRCSSCEEHKPKAAFSKNRSKYDGLHNQCKVCRNSYGKKNYQENTEKVLKINKAWKVANPEKVIEADRLWRLENLEHTKKVSALYRAQPRVKIAAKLRAKSWNEANSALKKETARVYIQAHPGKRKQYKHSRRALELNAEGSFTEKEWLDLVSQYNCTCPKCFKYTVEFEADHIISLKKGGTNWISNIQPLCRSCNRRKWIFDWGKFPIPSIAASPLDAYLV